MRDRVLLLLMIAACLGCRGADAEPRSTPVGLTPEAPAVTMAVTATPQTSLDPATQARRLGRGVNLGNALAAPAEGEWGMVIEAEFFPLIREAGFDTVRVPIRWSAHAQAQSPYAIDADFFERVDWVIEQAMAQDLNVAINMHHYEEIFVSPADHAERFVALWEQIAHRYRDSPATLYYELLNEPHDALDAGAWNDLLATTTAAVRRQDDYHTLIAGGAAWNSIGSLRYLLFPSGEENIIATFHYYEPFLFTHQGAEWAGPETGTLGVMWPGPPATELTPIPEAKGVEWVRLWFMRYNQASGRSNPASPEEIARALDDALAWSQQRGVPLWLGEFGAYSTADMDSRARWTAAVRREAEARGIPWAYWEFGAGFGVYDREGQLWRAPLLEALIQQSDD